MAFPKAGKATGEGSGKAEKATGTSPTSMGSGKAEKATGTSPTSMGSGKAGKASAADHSPESAWSGSLWSGKSGKGLKDKKEDILELLGFFFLWLDSLDEAFIEGIIFSIVGFLGGLEAAIEEFMAGIMGIMGVMTTKDSSVLTELQTEIAEEDLLIANLSMP